MPLLLPSRNSVLHCDLAWCGLCLRLSASSLPLPCTLATSRADRKDDVGIFLDPSKHSYLKLIYFKKLEPLQESQRAGHACILCATETAGVKRGNQKQVNSPCRGLYCVSGFISPKGAAWCWKEHQLGEQIGFKPCSLPYSLACVTLRE